jgi:PQQ-dependent dehydrogenase (methanol/ethanol family)
LPDIETALNQPSQEIKQGYGIVEVQRANEPSLRGFARNRSDEDLQLMTLDGRFHSVELRPGTQLSVEKTSLMPRVPIDGDELQHLLAYLSRRTGVEAVPTVGEDEAPSSDASEFQRILSPEPGEWTTYHGSYAGDRHSPLDQVTTENVDQLSLQWMYTIPHFPIQTTPIVLDGMMFVTGPNQVVALDPRTGREIWRYSRPRTPNLTGDGAQGDNRGVAILGDRVFYITDNTHLIALHRITGALLWEVVMPHDQTMKYGGTMAPLVVNDLVLTGVAGADEGILGFVAAYRASTGREVWRRWTIPSPDEAAYETWIGDAVKLGGGSTWLTGTYDPQADIVYWPTGNPYPDFDGSDRLGDNLYTASLLALNPNNGEILWHYQFTPHDLFDWDANQVPMLVDREFQGKPRKLVLLANRNGFFYVLDRISGDLLLAEPFVDKLTWATGIGSDGRPELIPGAVPTAEGSLVCPSIPGATNWMSPAHHPGTGLFYVMALEDCQIYYTGPRQGRPRAQPDAEPGRKFLRAIDVETGSIEWEKALEGPSNSWAGLMSTEGGLIFFGAPSGAFSAVDARNGQSLWSFQTNQRWGASPMTYEIDGVQFILIAAGPNILSFALPQ